MYVFLKSSSVHLVCAHIFTHIFKKKTFYKQDIQAKDMWSLPHSVTWLFSLSLVVCDLHTQCRIEEVHILPLCFQWDVYTCWFNWESGQGGGGLAKLLFDPYSRFFFLNKKEKQINRDVSLACWIWDDFLSIEWVCASRYCHFIRFLLGLSQVFARWKIPSAPCSSKEETSCNSPGRLWTLSTWRPPNLWNFLCW